MNYWLDVTSILPNETVKKGTSVTISGIARIPQKQGIYHRNDPIYPNSTVYLVIMTDESEIGQGNNIFRQYSEMIWAKTDGSGNFSVEINTKKLPLGPDYKIGYCNEAKLEERRFTDKNISILDTKTFSFFKKALRGMCPP